MAPPHCFVPEGLARGGRVWGLATQLYSLRSQTNWGVGDFTDLSRLVEWAGKELGAGIIGLNPLHALKDVYKRQTWICGRSEDPLSRTM